MSECEVQSFEDSQENRRMLAAFLERTFAHGTGAGNWGRRFEHWWDLNPFAGLVPERGWVARKRETGAVAGFLGLIPCCYGVAGRPTAALAPTTWVVDPAHRRAALKLGRRLQELTDRMLVVSTTGRREFREHLMRRGWVVSGAGTREFVPCGRSARWVVRAPKKLAEGRRLVFDADAARSIARGRRWCEGVEKWLTPEYLRWYQQSPAREHRFAGVVDGDGRVTSFLMMAPTPALGLLNVWSVVDWFTAEEDNGELRLLLEAVAVRPEEAGLCRSRLLRPLLLRLTEAGEESWKGVRGLFRSPVVLNHFHRAPENLRELPKRCVLAEGDLGL